MKLTYGQLRSLILEALAPSPQKRAAKLVQDTVETATKYVDSLVSGSPDRSSATKLKELIDQASSMAKWMTSHQDQVSPYLVRFAAMAQEVGKDVGFWQRPTFFGREEYVDKMKDKLQKLQRAEIDVLRRTN